VRSPEELRSLPLAEMTDEEYVAHLVHNYLRQPDPPRFSLLESTGMLADEYAAWIMDGTVPARVIRVRDSGARQLREVQDWYRRRREQRSCPG
jgi:hypothetical protein